MLASSCSFPVMASMSSANHRFVIFLPPMLTVSIMTFKCICQDAFEEDVEECWGKKTTLPYSDCGEEPFPYGTVEKNRVAGLRIQLFNDMNKVTSDDVLFHGCPES